LSVPAADGGASDRRVALVLGVVLACALLLLGSWLLVRGDDAGALDRAGFDVLALSTHGPAADAAPTVVDAAKAVLAVAGTLVFLVLARRRAWRWCAALIVGLVATQAAAHLLKNAIARSRPPHELVTAGGYSFPSTTSALGVCFAFMAIALAVPLGEPARRRTIAAGALLVLALGLSFVALRVHYLSDVIAGWALGVLVFAACAAASCFIAGRLGSQPASSA
jgi:undecaprenyl-diphosphatase